MCQTAGKVVAKFCAKYLHQQVLKHEAYAAGDVGTSVQRAFFRLCLAYKLLVNDTQIFLLRNFDLD